MTTTDGITYTSGLTSILENKSLESQAVGVDKKDFGTHYNPKTGLGFILKTSGDAVTNERILESKRLVPIKDESGKVVRIESYDGFMGNVNKHLMNSIKWSNTLRREIKNFSDPIKNEIIANNYNIPLKEVIVQYSDSNNNIKYELRNNFKINSKGQTTYDRYDIVSINPETKEKLLGKK
jgi:hypothetical protein